METPDRTFGTARTRLGTALLLLAAAAGLCEELAQSVSGLSAGAASAAMDVRFDELRKYLPAHGAVGYLSDAAPRTAVGSFELYWAEYSLAPVLLDPEMSEETVIGNFIRPRAAPAMVQRYGLTVERDWRNGVMLLRQARR